MWTSFFIATLLAIVLLYVPGALVLKAFRFSNIACVCAAPIPSSFFYAVVAVLLGKMSIPASGGLIFGAALVVSLVLFVVSLLIWKVRTKQPISKYFYVSEGGSSRSSLLIEALDRKFTIKTGAFYALFGLAVGFFVFVRPLDGPACFTMCYDDLTHMGLVQSFIETSNFSTLSTTLYPDFGNITPSYYPALWHQLVAMVATLGAIDPVIASNALNYIATSLLYPLGMFFLLHQVFKDNKRALIAGGFVCLAFVGFPWYFLIYGRLLPNMLAYTFIPAILACALILFASGQKRSTRIQMLLLGLCGCALAVFAQPNMLFAVVAMFVPYGVYRIWHCLGKRPSQKTRVHQIVGVVVFLVVVLAFWLFFLNAPFMRSVVEFGWPPLVYKIEAPFKILFFSGTNNPEQFILTAFALVGVYVSWKHKKYFWLTVTGFLTAFMYFSAASCDGFIDTFFSGFWYGDRFRLAALEAIAAVPLAALGLAKVYTLIDERFNVKPIAWAVMVVVMVAALFFPSFQLGDVKVKTPFGWFYQTVEEMYSTTQQDDNVIFSGDEQKFANKAKEITGEARVFNQPYDGSLFAYQYNGMRTHYRHLTGDNTENEKILRTRLKDYASDAEVQEAVNHYGIEYVIQLDYGHEPFHLNWPNYNAGMWAGIDGITSDTPGFELVLEEGDCRLYKLVKID